MERDPWWNRLSGPFPEYGGPKGVKADGGGSIRGCGLVGDMKIHRAVHNRDPEKIRRLVSEENVNVNEVEAAGCTPLHMAAFSGWTEGAKLLISLGALVNASNNAGETPWHWAVRMGHDELANLLEGNGASKRKGQVLVQEHEPKVKDFYEKACWKEHPLPYADFLNYKKKEREAVEAERKRAIRI